MQEKLPSSPRLKSLIFISLQCFSLHLDEKTCNLAVVCPTKHCLQPYCSSRDSALDDTVFITQLSNMAARTPEKAKDFGRVAIFL